MKSLSTTNKQLIEILNDGEFHSGRQLGTLLNMTRSAIWKQIKHLKDLGINIKSIKGKGYCLGRPFTLLNNIQIKNHISDKHLQQQLDIQIFDCIDSTNTYLKHYSVLDPSRIPICLAEQQTQGRGRLQRSWYSPFAANIYFSGRWQFDAEVSKLSSLSLVVSLAIVNMLAHIGLEDDIKIKWPNDIMWKNKKLAGILIEAMIETHHLSHVVIGIGINVNMPDSAALHIEKPWVSLNQIFNKTIDRNLLVALLIEELITIIDQFKSAGFAHFLNQWRRYDYLKDQQVQLTILSKVHQGQAHGVDEQGSLLLKKADGHVVSFTAGDASII
jgi:BirA family transcriptional regulator, biotin operon repressor / biotin---[acetyl-CoA-carboxylase] ligase